MTSAARTLREPPMTRPHFKPASSRPKLRSPWRGYSTRWGASEAQWRDPCISLILREPLIRSGFVKDTALQAAENSGSVKGTASEPVLSEVEGCHRRFVCNGALAPGVRFFSACGVL